eukprot:scaffold103864_cov14-Tisochrysis_lutea.AAC.1
MQHKNNNVVNQWSVEIGKLIRSEIHKNNCRFCSPFLGRNLAGSCQSCALVKLLGFITQRREDAAGSRDCVVLCGLPGGNEQHDEVGLLRILSTLVNKIKHG